MSAPEMAGGWPDLEWAATGRPIPGETQSGDLHVAAAFPGGALLCLIDGLGHGPEAAAVSRMAASVLAADPARPAAAQVNACHQALKGTRGVVLSLARLDFDRATMDWCGVGNVEAVLNRTGSAAATRRERILLRSGVVGYQLPPLRVAAVGLSPGDVLTFVSDGLRSTAMDEAPTAGPLPAQAARLLADHARGNDDAHVLMARFIGDGRDGAA